MGRFRPTAEVQVHDGTAPISGAVRTNGVALAGDEADGVDFLARPGRFRKCLGASRRYRIKNALPQNIDRETLYKAPYEKL